MTVNVTINTGCLQRADIRTNDPSTNNNPQHLSLTMSIDSGNGMETVAHVERNVGGMDDVNLVSTPVHIRADERQGVGVGGNAHEENDSADIVHIPETPEPPKSSQTEPESQEFSFANVSG